MSEAVLSLGTNLGDREDHLRAALLALNAVPNTSVRAVSSIYETDPVGYADQPAFLNMVIRLETTLSPRALLGACLGIEADLGRVRVFRNGPRVIDVDVLLMERVNETDAELTLPHPRMWERGFVLVPLEELYPDHIAAGWDFAEAANKVCRNGVRWWSKAPLL